MEQYIILFIKYGLVVANIILVIFSTIMVTYMIKERLTSGMN